MDVVQLLEDEEGFRKSAYQDHLGYWTIGFGRLIDARKNAGLSREEGSYLLKNDIAEREAALDEAIPWWRELTKARRAILLSMSFQMGVDGLLRFRNTLAAIEKGDYTRGAAGMMASRWARQTPGRAKRHSEIMKRGRFG